MMTFRLGSRYVDGNHFTRFGNGEDFRQQRIVTAFHGKANFFHRFADTHEESNRFPFSRSADMLGNAGSDFVHGFNGDVGNIFRKLLLSLQGGILTGDFRFFRYEVD